MTRLISPPSTDCNTQLTMSILAYIIVTLSFTGSRLTMVRERERVVNNLIYDGVVTVIWCGHNGVVWCGVVWVERLTDTVCPG